MEKEPYQFRRQRAQKDNAIDDVTLQAIEADARRTITPVERPVVKQRFPLTKKKIFIITMLIFIGFLMAIAFYWGRSSVVANKKAADDKTSRVAQKAIVQDKIDTSDLGKFITPKTGESWYESPKKLPSQGYVAASYIESVDYYEIGKRADNTIILAYLNYGLDGTLVLFEKSSNGTVRHIAQPSTTIDYSGLLNDTASEPLFIASVTEDIATRYDSLSIPKSLSVEGGDSVTQINTASMGSLTSSIVTDGVATKEVKRYGKSALVRQERKYVDTGLTSIGYAMRLPIGVQVSLKYDPLPQKLTGFSWANGITSDDGISGIVRGCGSSGSVSRADQVANDDFVTIGKTADGQSVYGFKNDNATLVTKAYQEYIDYNSYDSSAAIASKEEFIRQHGIFAYKSHQGEWLIYTTDTFSPATGCAKPVIYLYPTQTTQIAVKVGADVKVSEPLYSPQEGWASVIAQPNGQLSVDGREYGSLFWEGPGWGPYPAIDKGVVVKREQAVSTIKKQLAKQGLNARESQDFLDYWQDKIPNKPYIRLTWLTNAQLDELAPLAISPTPDTVHRVFLDMAGLDKPIKLVPQKLETVTRKGFTVIEWGGLAQGRLY
jgi:hypothetical protein